MKKIKNVSLGGISFTLDDDAYDALNKYLNALHKFYDNNPDGAEIISDIEARIAELILSDQIYTKIVTKEKIDTIVAQLGMPDTEGDENTNNTAYTAPVDNADVHIARRLYRIREGRVFGGVCAGMAKYWNIDAVWLRLILCAPFILLIAFAIGDLDRLTTIMADLWVSLSLCYIIMWIIIPRARTPRQYLEMRGEKITAQSIHKGFQNEISDSPNARKSASVWAEVLTVFGRIVLFCMKFIAGALGILLAFSAILFAIITFVIIIAPSAVVVWSMPLSVIFGSFLGVGVALGAMTVIAIALICALLAYILLSFAFDYKTNRTAMWTMLVVWVLLIIGICTTAACNVPTIRSAVGLMSSVEKVEAAVETGNEQRIAEAVEAMGFDASDVQIYVQKDSIANPQDSALNVNKNVRIVVNDKGNKAEYNFTTDADGHVQCVATYKDKKGNLQSTMMNLSDSHSTLRLNIDSDDDSTKTK